MARKTRTSSRQLRSQDSGGFVGLAALILWIAFAAPIAWPGAAAAQRAPVERVVDGRVVSRSDAALGGAIVYLKDSKSNAVKTYIAGTDGSFHFGQLSQNTDYELWADANGQRSKSKSISSFDSKNTYKFTLKIDTGR